MWFNGTVVDFKSTENELSAKKFDGTTWIEFERINGKPAEVKVNSTLDKGDIGISIQIADRIESVATGECTINLGDCEDGKYIITAKIKNAENLSIKYKFI